MNSIALRIAAAVTLCAAISPSASFAQKPSVAELKTACIASLSTEGSFAAGRRFKGHVDVAGANVSGAVVAAAQTLATDGHWKQIHAEKDIGTVTAVQDIPPGTKQFPINIIVKEMSGGVTIEASITTPSMIMVQAKGMNDLICNILSSSGG